MAHDLTSPMSKIKSAMRSDSFYSSDFNNTNYLAARNLSPVPHGSSLEQ